MITKVLVRTLLVTAISLAALLPGCKSFQDTVERYGPLVSFSKASVESASWQTVKAAFEFKLQNQVAAIVQLKTVNWSAGIHGTGTKKGSLAPELTLQPNETKIYRFIVEVPAGEGVKKAIESGVGTMAVEGSMTFLMTEAAGIKFPTPERVSRFFNGSVDFNLPRQPQMSFVKAEVETIDFLGANVNFIYETKNNAAFDITFSGAEYRFGKPDQPIGQAMLQQPVKVGSLQTQQIALPARIHFASLSQNLIALFQQKNLNLNMNGAIQLQVNDRVKLDLPVDATTVIGLPRLPDISFKTAKLSSLSFDHAVVEFQYDIKNNSPFSMNFGSINYAIAANENRVVQINNTEPVEVAANSTRTVPLKHSIHFVDVAKIVKDVFSSRTINLNLQGNFGNFMGKDGALPISGSFNFVPPRLPELSYNSFVYKSSQMNLLNPTAEFALRLNIKNPNSFAIQVKEVYYNFTALGTRLIEDKSAAQQVNGSSTHVLEIPVTLRGNTLLSNLTQLKSLNASQTNFEGYILLNVGGQDLKIPAP